LRRGGAHRLHRAKASALRNLAARRRPGRGSPPQQRRLDCELRSSSTLRRIRREKKEWAEKPLILLAHYTLPRLQSMSISRGMGRSGRPTSLFFHFLIFYLFFIYYFFEKCAFFKKCSNLSNILNIKCSNLKMFKFEK
jgi:hypothetical protein